MKKLKRVVRNRPLTDEEAKAIGKKRKRAEKDRRPSPEFAAMIAKAEVAAMLRRAREAAGLSLADLAERTGMSRPALSNLETGNRDNPTLATIERYAAALGKTVTLQLVDAEG